MHSIAETTESWGLSEVFVGVIILAIVGNAAEHSAAILVAMKNKMDIAVTIAIGSSSHVALLLAPVLGIAFFFLPPRSLDAAILFFADWCTASARCGIPLLR